MADYDYTDIASIEERHAVPGYAKWPVAIVRGLGAKVWDSAGREYLDLYGGHCVALIGHSHPRWAEAISAQAQRLGFYSTVASNDVRARFLEKLSAFAPRHLPRVFLCNSGAEANEAAVKLAMKATGRSGVIAMEGGFHGRTAGALSCTHLGDYRRHFPAIVRETAAAPFGDIAALKKLLGPDTAAVILEPIQSMNGVRVAAPDYCRALCEACHANGTLVIFDEVQTGMGRVGAPFAAELLGAKADLITLAKGIGGGFPLAAALATEAISRTVAAGEQGTTFGGGPMACAAGLAVLEVLEEEKLIAHAAEMEGIARELLQRGPVAKIRGRGLLLGLETTIPAKEVCRHLFEHGILAGTSADPCVLRLMPPLTVSRGDFEQLADALDRF